MNFSVPTQDAAFRVDHALGSLRDRLGLPSPDDPLPPGPWDPVIREIGLPALFVGPHPVPWHLVAGPRPQPWIDPVAGPHPDPWSFVLADPYGSLSTAWRSTILDIIRRRDPRVNDAIGGWQGRSDWAALNPQPLPPRWTFAAAAATQLVRRAELVADLGRATGAGGGASRWAAELVDDICGTPPRRWPWPWPWPRPNWLEEPIGSIDLIVVAGVVGTAAGRVFDGDLAEGLQRQAGRLAEEGTARLG